jgi:hypothetical protein
MLKLIKIKFYRLLSNYHFRKAHKGTESSVKHRRLGKIYEEKGSLKITCGCGRVYSITDKFGTFYCKCGTRIVFTNKS